MATQQAWFVIYPASEGISNAVPANQKIVEVPVTSAQYQAWVSNGSYQGWQVYMGPFPTQQAAQSAKPGAISVGTWVGATMAGILGGLGAAAGNPQAIQQATSVGTSTAVTNPLDYLKDIGNFFDKLSDPHTWLRLAEFAVGGMLLYLGLKTAFQGTGVGNVAKTGTSEAKKNTKRVAKLAIDFIPRP